jgi:hypothetical protein
VGADLDPDDLGPGYERDLTVAVRRLAGSFYTPRRIAEGLVAFAVASATVPRTVCDPAVGGGAFLLAAGRHLERHGLARAEIVRDRLWGADRDAHAVELTRTALRRWSAETGEATDPGSHLVAADSLADSPLWAAGPARGFDLVVGNPPFLSQLGRRTARTRREADARRARFGDVVGPYTDTAALFVLVALDLVSTRGRVALILPESFLAARDTAGVRDRVLALARLDGLWTAGEQVFQANVDVCAPVLVRGDRRPVAVRRAFGPKFERVAPTDPPTPGHRRAWSALTLTEHDRPALDLDTTRTLGELVRTTAGFRDQYYALSDSVFEAEAGDLDDDPARPKLITSGLIDPALCLWGRRSARFQRHPWARPRVDLDRLRAADGGVARWADSLLVPKVVVATQTRVIEAAVDRVGAWYPSTPTVAVVGRAEDLWSIAAVLLAPATSAWALERVAGAALARDAIKVSATDLSAMPLPTDPDAWRLGAALLESAADEAKRSGSRPALRSFSAAMGRAYATSGEVERWWTSRLPSRPLDGGRR